MWLSCATQEQIAEAVGVAQQTVKDWTDGFTESPDDGLSVFPPGFEPPIYNVWKKLSGFQITTRVVIYHPAQKCWPCWPVTMPMPPQCSKLLFAPH
jgi:hypothetical protein